MSVGKVFPSGVGVVEKFSNLLLALLYALFLYAFLTSYLASHRASSLLFLFAESLFIYFALMRKPPKEISTSLSVWLSAFAGSFLPLLMRPSAQEDAALGQAVQAIGVLLICCSILSLGRSFGLVAANRGVASKGMYRFVRHPLYLSYAVNQLGFLLNNATAFNVAVFALGLAMQLVRIRDEERLLLRDEAYVVYVARAKWRLLPYIF